MARNLSSIFLLVFVISNPAIAAEEDVAISLGRSIFEKGVGRDGREISAILHGGVVLRGGSVACSGCHGQDARGGSEGFIEAPDIRWLGLSKPYSARRLGSAGTPYDPVTFSRVLRSGVTAAGSVLDPAMPRFDLPDDEVRSLIAYLSVIDSDAAGKNSRPAVLGLLPAPGQSKAADRLGQKLKNCLPDSRNTRIAAVDILYFHDPEDAIAKLYRHIRNNPSSIILAPYLLGWESRYLEASMSWPVVTILPFSFLDPPAKNNWYYLFHGLQAQIRALFKYAKDSTYSQVRVLFDPHDDLSSELADFSEKIALQYRIRIIKNDEEPVAEASRTASLWLTPVRDGAFFPDVDFGELALVPALFHITEKRQPADLSGPHIRWAIAYPYPPRKPDGTPRNPIDVWGAAACEFLIQLDEIKIQPEVPPGVTLRWDAGLALPPKPDQGRALENVVITDEYGEPITIRESMEED